MPLEIVKSATAFESLRAEWDALTSEPLRSFDWHFAWWESFGKGCELKLYCYRRNGSLLGIAPFFVDSWLGQKRLRYLGSGATCTDYAQVIATPEVKAAFVKEIAQDLRASSAVSLIELDGVLASDKANSLDSELVGRDFWGYERELEPTWVLDLPETWNAFVSSAKKSLRRKINKAEKRLSSGEVVVRSTLDDLSFSKAFEILIELHQERFIGKGEVGVFADPRFTEFLSKATRGLSQRDAAEILVSYRENEPIACHLYLHGAAGPQLYQSGVRVSAMKLELGHLLINFAVKRAIENGCQKLDFLRGNEPYKAYWGAVANPLINIRCVSKKLLPSFVNRTYLALRSARNAVRQPTVATLCE